MHVPLGICVLWVYMFCDEMSDRCHIKQQAPSDFLRYFQYTIRSTRFINNIFVIKQLKTNKIKFRKSAINIERVTAYK